MKLMLRFTYVICFVLAGMLMITSCQANETSTTESQAQAQTIVQEEKENAEISTEGRLVPMLNVNLSFAVSGQVDKVYVREGDRVKAGEVLASLDTTEAQLSVEQAEADLEAAQLRYDQAPMTEPARKRADLTAARLSLLQAQDALADLERNAALQAARAQLAMAIAQQALKDAERERINLNYPRANQTTIDGAKAFYELKEEELKKAKQEYNNVRDLPADDPERNKKLLDQSNAQKERDKALATLNWYLGKNSEEDLAEADAKLALAKAELDIAQKELDLVKDGPAESDVALAKEKIANAQALLDLANATSEEQQIELVKIQLETARIRLKLAQAQLDKLTIKAPFDGVVASLSVKPGEWMMAGQAVIVLADLEQLVIETTDLSEIDVVNIQKDQSVKISVDALPDLILTGKVVSIGDAFVEARGDITYPVRIKLDKVDSRLKWGMTALVTFAK